MRPEYAYGAAVRDVGTFLQDQLVYSVHFLEPDRLVGCREEELQPADAPWQPSRFEFRETVRARIPLGVRGRALVQAGEQGQVMKVVAGAAGEPAQYHVHFAGRNLLQVPESALEPSAGAAGGDP